MSNNRKRAPARTDEQTRQQPVPLPPQQLQQLVAMVRQETRTEWSGPLPSPDSLKGYEQLSPGSADKIIGLMMTEAEHRRVLESREADRHDKIIDEKLGMERWGQRFGFILALGLIGVAFWAIERDADGLGIAAILTGGAALAALVFAERRKSKDQDEDEDPPSSDE